MTSEEYIVERVLKLEEENKALKENFDKVNGDCNVLIHLLKDLLQVKVDKGMSEESRVIRAEYIASDEAGYEEALEILKDYCICK